MHAEGQAWEDGLEAAAKFLEATAADYDQLSMQAMKSTGPNRLGHTAALNVAQSLSSTAQLLRGQAEHIRQLKDK